MKKGRAQGEAQLVNAIAEDGSTRLDTKEQIRQKPVNSNQSKYGESRSMRSNSL